MYFPNSLLLIPIVTPFIQAFPAISSTIAVIVGGKYLYSFLKGYLTSRKHVIPGDHNNYDYNCFTRELRKLDEISYQKIQKNGSKNDIINYYDYSNIYQKCSKEDNSPGRYNGELMVDFSRINSEFLYHLHHNSLISWEPGRGLTVYLDKYANSNQISHNEAADHTLRAEVTMIAEMIVIFPESILGRLLKG